MPCHESFCTQVENPSWDFENGIKMGLKSHELKSWLKIDITNQIYTTLAPSIVHKFIKFKFTRNVTVFAVDEMPPTGIVINGDVTT